MDATEADNALYAPRQNKKSVLRIVLVIVAIAIVSFFTFFVYNRLRELKEKKEGQRFFQIIEQKNAPTFSNGDRARIYETTQTKSQGGDGRLTEEEKGRILEIMKKKQGE